MRRERDDGGSILLNGLTGRPAARLLFEHLDVTCRTFNGPIQSLKAFQSEQ
jgi:hypothetical protein